MNTLPVTNLTVMMTVTVTRDRDWHDPSHPGPPAATGMISRRSRRPTVGRGPGPVTMPDCQAETVTLRLRGSLASEAQRAASRSLRLAQNRKLE
jgi:hypothetical protein